MRGVLRCSGAEDGWKELLLDGTGAERVQGSFDCAETLRKAKRSAPLRMTGVKRLETAIPPLFPRRDPLPFPAASENRNTSSSQPIFAPCPALASSLGAVRQKPRNPSSCLERAL